VRLANDTVALRAKLLVADDRLKVSTGEHEIGDWNLTDISARLLPDGCHVAVEGEELIISVPEPMAFAEAIGRRWTNPGNGSLLETGRRLEAVEPTGAIRSALATLGDRIPASVPALAAGAAVAIALAVWAPHVLITLVLSSALVALLVGSFALMDPFLAVRLPDPVTPTLLFRAGVAGVAVAIVLAVAL